MDKVFEFFGFHLFIAVAIFRIYIIILEKQKLKKWSDMDEQRA